VQDGIQFLGSIKRAQVAKLLRNCTTFVLPSRFETFGIAILEAMACKKPVVATTVGGIPEIIENGKNGILVEPDNPAVLAEALLTVLRDPGLQKTLANNGYATVHERFRSEKTGSTYEMAFAELLDSGSPGFPVARVQKSSWLTGDEGAGNCTAEAPFGGVYPEHSRRAQDRLRTPSEGTNHEVHEACPEPCRREHEV
jgi:hypothetical protein